MSALALDTATRNMEAGANLIGISQQDQAAMFTPEQRHELHLDLRGTTAAEVTGEDEMVAYVAIQPRKFGVPRGGLTYGPYVTDQSVESNSVLMRPKNAGDPKPTERFDALKMGIRGSGKLLEFIQASNVHRDRKLEAIHDVMFQLVAQGFEDRAFDERMRPQDASTAPDGGTNGHWMAAIVDSAEIVTGRWLPALATAKPYGIDPLRERAYRPGGIEVRIEATSRGTVEAMRSGIEKIPQLMEIINKGGFIRLGIDGYGGVGSWIHQLLVEDYAEDPILSRVIVTGLSDKTGAYVDAGGVRVMDFKTMRGMEAIEGATPTLEFACPDRPVSKSSNDLLTGDFDILVVASMANRIATAEDVQEYPEETRFSVPPEKIKAKYVVEAGNNSITFRSQNVLHKRDIVIDTGIYVNSQGAAASKKEYDYGKRLMVDSKATPPSLEVCREDLAASMRRRDEAITAFAQENGVDRVLAAYAVAAAYLAA